MKKIMYILIIIIVLFVFAIIIKNYKNNQFQNPNTIKNKIENNLTGKKSDGKLFNGKKNNIVCNMEYKPICGEIQIQCIKAPCESIKKTFTNICELQKNKLAKFLYNGECSENKNQKIANPASVNCEKKGGMLEIKTDLNGGQYGICHLSNGNECEERAFFRGECK